MSDQAGKPLSTWEQDSSFLPEDYVRSKGERRANLLSLSLFGVMMFAVVAAFFATNKRWMTVRSEKQSINAAYVREAGKIDELKALEQQRDDLIKKAEVTAALVERVPRSLIFAQIVSRMPRDVKLLELELESELIKQSTTARKTGKSAGVRTLSGSGGSSKPGAGKDESDAPLVPQYRQSLSMVGVGLSNDDIADYIEALRDCAILDNIELQYIKRQKIEGVELRKFELLAKVRGDVDARGIVDPEDPADLPEVLDPTDLVPTTPVFVPPSQFDENGDPVRPSEEESAGEAAIGFLSATFETLKEMGRNADGDEPQPAAAPQAVPEAAATENEPPADDAADAEQAPASDPFAPAVPPAAEDASEEAEADDGGVGLDLEALLAEQDDDDQADADDGSDESDEANKGEG
ncbi:MAG: PilN domain-containing protein [Planctomycetota bacterium]